ncbi:transglycosylase SLT domain-containing protein [Aeromonas allosaccharophila]|uniref:transglycosylase SLT domain-containing protein n=1 Tax=Aeromonas TaxID=642 RepID=UPI0011EE7F33|nr:MULTISPECIES: transglycosylase SLT domain-containing protein [Aeromonas]MBP8218020.1 transglycosylase SLT domain-containing protein [Aeromonas sp.]MBL0440492.1 transglycosylase SLT domain-containing protein [Aeromonas veronii]MBO0502186.1 transglycosylase SLT domain-containing protein [Aeromonas veronii]MBS4696935.1 transglycosylase SLT domain-containing protein [Aeromonas allosaccharophila]BBU04059.1 murein transglycosylase [Aeromonas veronii]
MKAVWGIVLSALFVPTLMAKTADQTLYRQAYDAVRANDQARFQQIRARLTHYPLLPYLDYYQLAFRPGAADYNDVTRFIRQHGDTPQSNRLERSYLTYLAQSQQWSQFLRFYPAKPSSTDLLCMHYQALYYTGKPKEALQGAGKIWMSGQSRPDACSPLFLLWQASGQRTQEKIWQRMTLAFEAENPNLIRHLGATLGSGLQSYGDQMVTLFEQPAKAMNPAYFSNNPYSRKLLSLGLTRYANQEPESVLRQLALFRSRFGLTQAEVKPVERAIARRLLLDRAIAQRSWVDSTVKKLADPDITELRARLAIWEQDWRGLSGWVKMMPMARQKEDRWRYWMARSLEVQGQQKPARDLYLETANLRGFYGFMAAQRTGVPYRIKNQSVKHVPDWRTASQRWPFLLRVRELLSMNEIAAARSEWIHNMDRNPVAQRIEFGHIALNQGWHELAILASIRAEAWDALDLRFPLPLKRTFSQMAQERTMNTSLLYAISRQESALYPQAQSPVGARGLMQLMPATAKETAGKLGVPYRNEQQLFDPAMNIRLGSAYLKRLLDVYDGNRILAAAAYNAGPGRVKRWRDQSDNKPMDVWVESIPYKETRNYVQNVLSFDLIYQHKLQQPLRFMSERELNHAY